MADEADEAEVAGKGWKVGGVSGEGEGVAPDGRAEGGRLSARAKRGRAERQAIDALGDAIAETAAHVDAATHRLLAQIREFDEAGGWHAQGALSCAHWLSWRIGLSPGVARERVRVARALGKLPAIDWALSRGEVSYCKVRAMTRVATPATEEALLGMARHATGAELEKICRLYRSVTRKAGEAGDSDDDRRQVTARATDDGMVRITAVVTPEESARILKAVDTAAERVSAETQRRGGALPRAEGLGHVAESYLRGDAAHRAPVELVVTAPRTVLSKPAGVSAETSRDHRHAGVPCAPEPADERSREHGRAADRGASPADHPRVRESAPVEGKVTRDVATIDDTAVSAETARRLACDAGVVSVTTDDRGNPLDVGRKRRTISPALRRALKLRDGGCAYPGCSNHRFVDAHHIVHWAEGGETKADNLVLLCRSHHALLHEAGFRIEPTECGFAFYDPEGRAVPYAGKRTLACVDTLLEAHADRGLQIDPDTNMPKWSGEPPDYSACIDALVSRAHSTQ